jgi:hypothetical protein
MSRFSVLALCVAIFGFAVVFPALTMWAGDPAPAEEIQDDPFADGATAVPAAQLSIATTPKTDPTTAASETKIRASLDEQTKMEIVETPLAEVIAYLKDLHAIEIQFDSNALEDIGVDQDSPVTLNLKSVSLRSALHLLLRPLGLAYVIRDGVLLITNQDVAENLVELRVYDASQLHGPAAADVCEFAETLRTIFKDAGNFTVVPYRNLLVVSTSEHGHEELSALLDQMKSKISAAPVPAKP